MNETDTRIKLCEFLGWTDITILEANGSVVGRRKPNHRTLERLPALDHNLIYQVQRSLTGEMWAAYAAELENMMLNNTVRDFEKIKYANTNRGMNILFLNSSVMEKAEAILKGLGLWFRIR